MSLLALGALGMPGITGCRRPEPPPPPPATQTDRPKEVRPIMGGTQDLRLQITPSPNPPYVGLNAFDLWLTDPSRLLAPVPGGKITLRAVPPSEYNLPIATETVTTDSNGKAVVRLGLGASGQWTLKATVASPKNGKLDVQSTINVRLLPGQENPSKIPAGPVRTETPEPKAAPPKNLPGPAKAPAGKPAPP